MAKNILITGGTGMIGSRLSELLMLKGYQVAYLSRRMGNGKIKTYAWDIEKQKIDEKAILEADYVIHLAGANVFEKKWTPEFKKEILDSRVKSTDLLYGQIKTLPHHIKAFISASAIGIYGDDRGGELLTEETPGEKSFLSDVVQKWEASAEQIKRLNIRTVKIRIGIVLSEKGGALEQMLRPIKLGVGASLGSGEQYISWIHLDDLCNIFIKAIEDEKMEGPYNAVAPEPVSNKKITQTIAEILNKPVFLPSVPSFVLNFILGKEKAKTVLGGTKVSARKIINAGYDFIFPSIEAALKNLLSSPK